MRYVVDAVHGLDPDGVLDIGGRNVNGSPRGLFACDYVAVDRMPGRGVDVVADAATWEPPRRFGLVLCLEVFEHTPDWPAIVGTARKALDPGGRFVVTAASDPRDPHSAVEGGPLRDGEHYANIAPDELAEVLSAEFDVVDLRTHPRGDVYATAVAR